MWVEARVLDVIRVKQLLKSAVPSFKSRVRTLNKVAGASLVWCTSLHHCICIYVISIHMQAVQS